ncbi:hypothetical protein SETIT_7G137400v2 [Setaria italica]|uniref:Uncharacterized protein n=1 Tax=Setaria italica TaxID=4555 RepID=A0A368RVD8_SETIT|nr:hypothetical protein SETIT_7G137400v2 [Setaria italica]
MTNVLIIFEMNKDKDKRFILDPACTILKIGVNYNDLVSGGVISDVRLEPLLMMEKFDVLHKCNSASDEVKKAIILFAVNISEGIQIECIFKKILKPFDNHLRVFTLGEVLALKAKRYGYYSREYLRCLNFIIKRQPVLEI